jgi:hypothetical protein
MRDDVEDDDGSLTMTPTPTRTTDGDDIVFIEECVDSEVDQTCRSSVSSFVAVFMSHRGTWPGQSDRSEPFLCWVCLHLHLVEKSYVRKLIAN